MKRVRAAAIVLGAGAGRRLGADEPKAFLLVGGRPILQIAAAAAAASPAIDAVVVTAPEGWEERALGCLSDIAVSVRVVAGGGTRQASVRAALEALPDGLDTVAVHDAARPFAPPEAFTEVVAAVSDGADGAIPIVPIPDTLKRVRGGLVVGTEPREELVLAQTPQGFRVAALLDAHERAHEAGREFTDDAAALEWAGYTVRAVPGDPQNFKITTLMDLARAETRMGGAGL